MPWADSARDRLARASLIRWAPSEPPVTSRGRAVVVEPECGQGLIAHGRPVQRGDEPAQGHTDLLGSGQRRAGEGRGDGAGQPSSQAVGQSGSGVLLVQDDRQPPPSGRQVGRRRHVAAEADDDLRAGVVHGLTRGLDGRPQRCGQTDQGTAEAAGHGHPGHDAQVVPALGDQPGFQTLDGAQDGEPQAGMPARQGVGDGEQRRDVAGGAAAGEQHGRERGSVGHGRAGSASGTTTRQGSTATGRPRRDGWRGSRRRRVRAGRRTRGCPWRSWS